VKPRYKGGPDRFTEVRFDNGGRGWVNNEYLRPLTKPDVYERLRDPAIDLAATSNLKAQLAELARAIGPGGSLCGVAVGTVWVNSYAAAGLLSLRPLESAISQVLALAAKVRPLGAKGEKNVPLGPERDEFAAAWKRRRKDSWEYSPRDLVGALLGGIMLLIYRASDEKQVPASKLLSASVVAQLQKEFKYFVLKEGKLFTDERPSPFPYAHPMVDDDGRPMSWAKHGLEAAAQLKLPPGSLLISTS
jgi:hypothetical protein